MTDYLKFVENIVEYSKQSYKQMNRNRPKKPVTRWKYCAALLESGWKSTECKVVKNSSDLIFVWNKEGEKEINVRLSFVEQRLWLAYLERWAAKEKHNDDDKNG